MARSLFHFATGVAVVLVTVTSAAFADEAAVNDQGDAASLQWDLSQPQYDPADCPAWVKVETAESMRPYIGKNGLPEPWRNITGPLGSSTKGIDRYQANQFVVYREETADYLYSEYTPSDAGYQQGTLPRYEAIVQHYTTDEMTDTEKALVLLTEAMPEHFRHPTMPPLGPSVAADRDLADEALLETGSGWCNEQARVFIRLCQVAGMQGRIIHLFGQSHTIAEFYADGQWVMADASNFFVARNEDGKLLSAAESHDGGAGQLAYAKAKKQRLLELAEMSAAGLGMNEKGAERFRANARSFDVEKLAARDDLVFGVINYPVPPSPGEVRRR